MRTISCCCIAFVLWAAMAVDVCGADVTWTNKVGDLNWGTAANWTNNVVPGTGDRAVFVGNTYASNSVIHLGADRTVRELRFASSAPQLTLTGDGLYSLTLTNGNISTDGSGFGKTYATNLLLACDVILGASGVWQHLANYGCSIMTTGTLSDGGRGYGVATDIDRNHNLRFFGPATYSGTTTVSCMTLVLGGANGTLTNSDVALMPTVTFNSGEDPSLYLENTVSVNADRFGDNRTVHGYTIGQVYMFGNATLPVSETIGGVSLHSGVLTLQSRGAGTNVELIVKSITRQPGTALIAQYSGSGTVGTTSSIRMQGESVNTNGLWRPWAFNGGYVMVDTNCCLISVPSSSYKALPVSGSFSTNLYRANGANLTLTASESVWGLRMDFSGPGTNTINLGTNDLTIACGSLALTQTSTKLVNSTGGRLVFDGNEVIILGSIGGAASTNQVIIHAPLAATGTGSKTMCLNLQYCDSVVLDGEDQVGTYASIFAGLRPLVPPTLLMPALTLGGPSDRTVNGPFGGTCNLVKRGTGTLWLNGPDTRLAGAGTGAGSSCTTSNDVREGRVVIGHPQGLVTAPSPAVNCVIVRSGARLDVTTNITWSGGLTAESNATLGGCGTFNWPNASIAAGVRLAPGSTNAVGKLTTPGFTLGNGSAIDWKLGNGTAVAGTDYDLLHVAGNLTLSGAGSSLVLTVTDLSAGKTRATNARFTVADWASGTPSTAQTWTIVNNSPKFLDTTHASVQVNTTDKKIYLSGVVTLRGGGTVLFAR